GSDIQRRATHGSGLHHRRLSSIGDSRQHVRCAGGAGVSDSSAEAALFVSTARAFLDKQASLADVRALHADGQSFDPDWWQRAAELGWTSLLVSEEIRGGSGFRNPVGGFGFLARRIG